MARDVPKHLAARCEEALDGLLIPSPWDVVEFVLGVSRARRRPIVLKPWPTAGGISGCWVETEDRDYIMYARNTTPLHQSQIICHEVAHMWLGHPSHSAGALTEIRGLPHRYQLADEQEAEELARLVLERAALPLPPEVSADVLRVIRTFDQGVTVDTLADVRTVPERGVHRGLPPVA